MVWCETWRLFFTFLSVMPETLIQQSFIDGADWRYRGAEELAPLLAHATHLLLECLGNGGRVLVCAAGPACALAAYGADLLQGGLGRARLPLPALALGALRGQSDLAGQVRALGHGGDVLLALAPTAAAADELAPAVRAAHERDLQVVALAAAEGDAAAALPLQEADVLVPIAHSALPRVLEAQQLALHCLCAGLDELLLGPQP